MRKTIVILTETNYFAVKLTKLLNDIKDGKIRVVDVKKGMGIKYNPLNQVKIKIEDVESGSY